MANEETVYFMSASLSQSESQSERLQQSVVGGVCGSEEETDWLEQQVKDSGVDTCSSTTPHSAVSYP